MLRKHLAVVLAAPLAVVACAPCARAQSGRRFPKAAGDKGFVALTGEKSAAGTRTERAGESGLRSPDAKRPAPFADDEDDDEDDENVSSDIKLTMLVIAGVIVLFVVANAKSKGYAPAGTGAPFRRVH